MSTVSKRVDKDLELTEFNWSGKVSLDEVIDTLNEYYQHPTKNLIWDLSEADISNATNDDLKKIISFTQKSASNRPHGKTAILGSTDLHFGLARMYATFCEFEHHPIQISVFRSKDSAIDWISHDD